MEYKIVIASTNQGKMIEIGETFKSIENFKIKMASLKEYNIAEPDEPYDSFMQNAIHKVKYYANLTHEMTLSEDSGLCIVALNGLPGVRSKEFIAECGGISNALGKIEEDLQLYKDKTAYFNSAVALYIPSKQVLITHEARDYGVICFPPRGTQGFAYDPIFAPNGSDKTFAELGMAQKNKISHRKKAMLGIVEKLQEYLKSAPG